MSDYAALIRPTCCQVRNITFSVEHEARQPRRHFRVEGDEHQPDDLDDDERNDAAVDLAGGDS